MSKETTSNPLIHLGLGVGLGVCSLWVLLELWPLIVLGGAGFLLYKGMQIQKTKQKETTE